MMLYYNCGNPLAVLQSRVIKPSKVLPGQTRGVSLSTNYHMASHGPFKISFYNPIWEKQLKQCLYMHPRKTTLSGTEGKHRIGNVIGYHDQFGKLWTIPEYQSLVAAQIAKHSMFVDEEEWWSPTEIRFEMEDIYRVEFMTNAPCVQPRLAKQARLKLSHMHLLYREVVVNDPYLSKSGEV